MNLPPEWDDEVDLPYIRTIPATKIVLCMSKLAHKIHNGELASGRGEWTENDGTEISVDMQAPEMPIELTTFDMAVYTAIVSIYDSGTQEFTTSAVCRLLCLKQNMNNISTQLKTHVQKSIEKMAKIKITICRKLLGPGGGKYSGALLEIETFFGRTDNGRTCIFWRCPKPPILYKYSQDINHCWNLLLEDVQTGSALSNTIYAIVVRYCLLRRLVIIRRQLSSRRRSANRIEYSQFCKEIGRNNPDEFAMLRLRRVIQLCLECWQETGVITTFSEYKERNKIIGVEIQMAAYPTKTKARRK